MISLKYLPRQIGQYLHRGCDIIANEGFGVLLGRISMRLKRGLGGSSYGNFDHGYDSWRVQHGAPISHDKAASAIESMAVQPTFSIIMPVYNVELRWLKKAVESVKNQLYPHWQLCIVDDASSNQDLKQYLVTLDETDPKIQVKFNETNTGIGLASSTAVAMAQGDFIALLDHDDLLAPDALLCNALLINQYSEVDFIYSDEDKVDINEHFKTPFFKPDFSPERLHAQNYIGHFVVLRKALVDEIGGFRIGFDGAQDYDLILRASAASNKIKHIPKVLYHWREIPGSTADSFGSKSYAWEAGRQALQDHFRRIETKADVSLGRHPGTYHAQFQIRGTPKISTIIPFKDQPELLNKCLQSLFAYANGADFEVIAINNNSTQPETREVIARWRANEPRIRFVDYPHAFNFSAICNYGVAQAAGGYIMLINSDIEITAPDWIKHLLIYAQNSEVGAVGAKLLFPNGTVQHAGIAVGIDGGAGHPLKHFPKNHRGYFLSLELPHNVSAVSAALLMVRREKYLEVGGLDEDTFAVAYNDVDFCLKLLSAGYRNVYTPNCTAIHRESSTRGYEIGEEKQNRHDREKRQLQEKWQGFFDAGDPFYNRNLTRLCEDNSLNHKVNNQQSMFNG